jgi:hypothetical protein
MELCEEAKEALPYVRVLLQDDQNVDSETVYRVVSKIGIFITRAQIARLLEQNRPGLEDNVT